MVLLVLIIFLHAVSSYVNNHGLSIAHPRHVCISLYFSNIRVFAFIDGYLRFTFLTKLSQSYFV
jgi:hypothetical protein